MATLTRKESRELAARLSRAASRHYRASIYIFDLLEINGYAVSIPLDTELQLQWILGDDAYFTAQTVRDFREI